MNEKYPESTIGVQSATSYGPGLLLPSLGSASIAAGGYEAYMGVQLLPHDYLGKAVVHEAVTSRAETLKVTLSVHENTVSFEPHTTAEIARELGSLVNHRMHMLAEEEARPKVKNGLAIAS